MVRLFMSLPYHVPTPANIGLVPLLAWPKGWLTYQKKCIFHTLREKTDQHDFLPHPSFPNSKFPHMQFHLNGNKMTLPPFAQHNMGSVTQHSMGKALVTQQRAVLWMAPFHQVRLQWLWTIQAAHSSPAWSQNKSYPITLITPQNPQRVIEKYSQGQESKGEYNSTSQIPTSHWILICDISQHTLWINSSLHRCCCKNLL